MDAVPTTMGMKAVHTIQVVYIVKAINLASLRFSGILRVLNAYTVHRKTKNIAYTREVTSARSEAEQSIITLFHSAFSLVTAGGCINSHATVTNNCTDTNNKHMTI